MDRALDSLSAAFRPLVVEVLARLTERGIPTMIVQTGRSLAEHRVNLANGTSRSALSKHLPRAMRGWADDDPDAAKCDAIDLCPYETYALCGPDKLAWTEHATPQSTAAWAAIMEEGEKLGLRSGARWHDPHDPGHLELVFHS